MEKITRHRVKILIGLLLTLCSALLMTSKPSSLESFESKLYDYRFKIRGRLSPPDSIVIAAIDEKSIERLGRWPWNRDRLAALVDKLGTAGAELVVFDIILSEHERNDKALAGAMREASNVILPIVFDDFNGRDRQPRPDNDVLLQSAFVSVEHADMFESYRPITADRVLVPVPQLMSEVMTLGHINMIPDTTDGTLRWESLVIAYNGHLYPSITLQAAATYLGIPREKMLLEATTGLQLGKRFIPTDRYGRMLINYYGSNDTFRYISISDILDGTADPKLLAGKIVLVGATAVGIYDLRVTPLSPAMPGVEKHASVIASILNNRLLTKVPVRTDLIVVIVSGILFALLISRLNAAGAAGATGLALLAIAALAYGLFVYKGLWLNVTYPSLNVLLIFVSITAYNYEVEERFARQMRAMFSSYVTERVVNELIKNPGMARLGGERREITVLFSDVRGFTTFSERYAPEEVVSILNEYLGVMTETVFKWEGTLDKFIGDAILAFWGAPLPQEDQAILAVKCALDMIGKLGDLQKKWQAEGKEGLDIGIGINTGEVLVGNIGAEGKKMDYTVIGDHVNLGSRVEGLTKKYHSHILITESTLDKIRDAIDKGIIGHVAVTGHERVIVKGKEQPVGIYEVISLEPGSPSCVNQCDPEKIARMKEK